MYRIGEFSKMAKSTVKTLRFYDEIGLFNPKFVDENGYRYYSIEQLKSLQTIIELRSVDVSLEDIKAVVSGKSKEEILSKRMFEIKDEQSEIKIKLSLIKRLIAEAKKGVYMEKYQVKEIVMPECFVYSKQGIIENFSKITPFILEAGKEAQTYNFDVKCIDPGYCFVSYLAREYQDSNIEILFCEAVDKMGKDSKNIKFKKLEAENAVSVFHKGSYSKIGEAYAFVMNWIEKNGYQITNPIRERYISGCWNKDSEEDYLTEIQVPVAKK
ncbi:MAG: MerR family transcriptional regulator [Clostridia bacterium]